METRIPAPALLPLPTVERATAPARASAPAAPVAAAQTPPRPGGDEAELRISNAVQALAGIDEGEQLELPISMDVGSSEWAGAQLLLMIGLIERAVGAPPQNLARDDGSAAEAAAQQARADVAAQRARGVEVYRQVQAERSDQRVELQGELLTADAQRLDFSLRVDLATLAPAPTTAAPLRRQAGLELSVPAPAAALESARFRFDLVRDGGELVQGSGQLLLQRGVA